MKKWFVLSLALVTAAISHAVTVSWVVPNSSYNTDNWAYKSTTVDDKTTTTLNINIYFVYSATEISSLEKVRDFALAGVGTHTDDQTVATVAYGNVMEKPHRVGQVLAYANGLPPEPNGAGNVIGSGFYYMVVIDKAYATTENYAVAGTGSLVTFDSNGDNGDGVYASNVGVKPSTEDYFEIGWLGGSSGWTQALVPEPTVLALLAMGVAGVALRRKQNFLK